MTVIGNIPEQPYQTFWIALEANHVSPHWRWKIRRDDQAYYEPDVGGADDEA